MTCRGLEREATLRPTTPTRIRRTRGLLTPGAGTRRPAQPCSRSLYLSPHVVDQTPTRGIVWQRVQSSIDRLVTIESAVEPQRTVIQVEGVSQNLNLDLRILQRTAEARLPQSRNSLQSRFMILR